MYTLKTLSILAVAATTVFAAPTPAEDVNALEARGGYAWRGGNRFWNRPGANAYVTVTGYGDTAPAEETAAPALQTWAAPAPAPAVETSAPAPVVETPAPVVEAPATGGWGQPSAPAAQPSVQPSSAPAPSTPSVGGGGDWFDIANKWRVAGGKSAFTEDATLVANAQKTADESVGGLHHQLNPGTFAQVLAPGDASNFESVYLGGWLCELPNSPGLNGACASATSGWDHSDGEVGHAEILTGSYTKIGCALSSGTGVWACDLA